MPINKIVEFIRGWLCTLEIGMDKAGYSQDKVQRLLGAAKASPPKAQDPARSAAGALMDQSGLPS